MPSSHVYNPRSLRGSWVVDTGDAPEAHRPASLAYTAAYKRNLVSSMVDGEPPPRLVLSSHTVSHMCTHSQRSTHTYKKLFYTCLFLVNTQPLKGLF